MNKTQTRINCKMDQIQPECGVGPDLKEHSSCPGTHRLPLMTINQHGYIPVLYTPITQYFVHTLNFTARGNFCMCII